MNLVKKRYLKFENINFLIFCFFLLFPISSVLALSVSSGDGILIYGASGNTTPQVRLYTESTNSFGSPASTVSGSQPNIVYVRTSPTQQEAIVGYIDTGGTLQVMCYDGNTWSNEWSVSVGSATIRRFNIAYETNSGDVLVLYSRNTPSTNELGYRTKSGLTGCGSSNWSSENTLDATRTSGTVQWVELSRDMRSTSDRIAAAWTDTSSDLSVSVWNGSSWESEPASALETNLDFVSSASDVDNIEVETEATTGEPMVVWGRTVANNISGWYYSTCTGTDPCTWSSPSTVNATGDRVQWLEMDSDPLTDDLVIATHGEAGTSDDTRRAYWNGTAWTAGSLDASSENIASGRNAIASGFITNGGSTYCVVQYDDGSGGGISWRTSPVGCSSWTSQVDITVSPTINDLRDQYESQQNPFDGSQLIVMISDSTGSIYSKRLVLESDGTTFTWSEPDGQSSLGTVNNSPNKGFSFAYWNYVPAPSGSQPTVTTNFLTNLTNNSATLNGLKTGGDDATEHGFAYGIDSGLQTGVSTTTEGILSGNVAFASNISLLSSDQTYYYRAYAINASGTGYGVIRSFYTGNSNVNRLLVLFEGFIIKLFSGKIKIIGY